MKKNALKWWRSLSIDLQYSFKSCYLRESQEPTNYEIIEMWNLFA